MSFLLPLALFLGLLAIPVILLYMLRLRRREQIISSTMLWRELAHDRSANMPWQRLRRNLLLILQLIILAALVLALARPFIRATGQVDGHLIVLLDASASMATSDGEGGLARFDQAVAEIEKLVSELSASDQMTLISVGRSPAVLATNTNNQRILQQALDSAAVEYASADWIGAFALAGGTIQSHRDARVVVVSDGNLPENLPALPGKVEFIPVGRSGSNLAIASQAARPSADGLDYLASVSNYGNDQMSALLSLFVNDGLVDSRRISVAPGESVQTTWDLPKEAAIIEARVTTEDGVMDYLAVDNAAWTVAENQADQRVFLLSEGNVFLERLFALLPGFSVTRTTEGQTLDSETGDESPYDLYIFDGVPLPNPLPAGNILIFNPQPSDESAETSPSIRVSSIFTNTQMTRLANNPLLEDVDWNTVNVGEARVVEANGLETIVEAEGGPLLMAGEIDGRRVGLFTFDLRRSDLPLQIAFPVVMANITDWLNPGSAFANVNPYQTGSIVNLIPNPRSELITVTSPNGDVWEYDGQSADELVIFTATQEPGIYTVVHTDASGQSIATDRFAVNFNNSEESRIRPRQSIRFGESVVEGSKTDETGRYEIWPWLMLAGLIILLVEWWVAYSFGLRQPSLKFR